MKIKTSNFSLGELHDEFVNKKGTLSFKKANVVKIACPYCGETLYHYVVKSNQDEFQGAEKWTTVGEAEGNVYYDGDNVLSENNKLLDYIDAELLTGSCSFCGKGFLSLVCFFVTEKEKDFSICNEMESVKDALCVEQYDVFLSSETTASRSIGRLLIYRQVNFGDTRKDLFRIDIDSISNKINLSGEYGVCNGHSKNAEQRAVWENAEQITEQIYAKFFEVYKSGLFNTKNTVHKGE